MIGQTFGRLGSSRSLQRNPDIGLYWDDPSIVPADQLRSQAGFIVSPNASGYPPEMEMITIEEGTFVVRLHTGCYHGMSNAWEQFFSEVTLIPHFECSDCLLL